MPPKKIQVVPEGGIKTKWSRAIRYGDLIFTTAHSAARPDGSMEVVKLVWWEHNCPSGQYSAAKVHRSLRIGNIDDPNVLPTVSVDEAAIPGLKYTLIDGE